MSLTTTTLTQLWTLTHGANVIRRTTFDQPLTYDGNLYAVAPLQPSNFDEQAEDLTPNQLEMAINLEGSGITEAALMGHSWDRAKLLIQVIDYNNLPAAPVRKWKGQLANSVVHQGQLARCEFLSLLHLLTQPIGYLYSPTCDAEEYGGTRCGKDVTAETFTGEVVSVVDGANFTVNITQAEADYFQFGPCKFTSGANTGADRLEIKTSTPSGANTVLQLVQDFPFTVAIGDDVQLIRGCNREFETCKARGNALRFRGQPNIPGLDKLLRRFPE